MPSVIPVCYVGWTRVRGTGPGLVGRVFHKMTTLITILYWRLYISLVKKKEKYSANNSKSRWAKGNIKKKIYKGMLQTYTRKQGF